MAFFRSPRVETINAVAKDPLLHFHPLPYSVTCYPLGYPVCVRTDWYDVMEAVEDSFGGYDPAFDAPPLEVRVLVSNTQTQGVQRRTEAPPDVVPIEASDFPDPPVFRAFGDVMSIVSDRHNYAVCHFDGNAASIHVERRVVADRPWFRMRFLESTVLSILSARYFTPVHAACVASGERGVLLHAVSGSGKSCLAYECARRGWTYVCDDASFLRREGDSRIVLGRPRTLKFMESALTLFPELEGLPTVVDPRGKPVILMNPADNPTIRTSVREVVSAVVFLRRERGRPAIHGLDREEAWNRLLSELVVLTIPSLEAQQVAMRRLLEVPVVEMRYWTLEEGVALLEELVGDLG